MRTTPAYWLCDPAESIPADCETMAEAMETAVEWVQEYRDNCDPEWPEGVTRLCIVYGVQREDTDDDVWDYLPVVAKVVEVNRIDRPATQEERDESGLDWSVDWYCDYRMEVVSDANNTSAS